MHSLVLSRSTYAKYQVTTPVTPLIKALNHDILSTFLRRTNLPPNVGNTGTNLEKKNSRDATIKQEGTKWKRSDSKSALPK